MPLNIITLILYGSYECLCEYDHMMTSVILIDITFDCDKCLIQYVFMYVHSVNLCVLMT